MSRQQVNNCQNRWLLALFFNILDVAALASYIIYYENNKMLPKKTNQRRLFLRQLSEELAISIIENYSQNLQVMRNYTTKLAIESVLERQVNPPVIPSSSTPMRDNTGRKFVQFVLQGDYQKTKKNPKVMRAMRKTCVR